METTILKSEITYPECGQKKRSNVSRILPIFYEGGNCKTVLKPKGGICCVYCSYRTESCPPI
ncbi:MULTISPECIES: GDCCVxC domain-containing (seleno)protein [Flavobacteriaceae]|uniref:GDCCVxC domain-containing (seleno)protein n=1 Tax=Flavobacteriaceae TaxID=49546 RepID=UPI000B853177|nr:MULTISPECIES: GDCCVxC domain-containing (seleno)protein [Flavobacteriaceae]